MVQSALFLLLALFLCNVHVTIALRFSSYTYVQRQRLANRALRSTLRMEHTHTQTHTLSADNPIPTRKHRVPFSQQLTASAESTLELINDVLKSAGLRETRGLAIVLGTVAMKAVLLPLSLPPMRSAARKQRVVELRRRVLLTERDAETRERLLVELDTLLLQENSNAVLENALGVLQMPVTSAMQRALQSLLQQGKLDEAFLFVPSLQGPAHDLPVGEKWTWLTSLLRGKPLLGWSNTMGFLSLPLLLVYTQFVPREIRGSSSEKSLDESTEISSQTLLQQATQLIALFNALQSVNAPSALLLFSIVQYFVNAATESIVNGQAHKDRLPPAFDKYEEHRETKIQSKPSKKTWLVGISKYGDIAATATKKIKSWSDKFPDLHQVRMTDLLW